MLANVSNNYEFLTNKNTLWFTEAREKQYTDKVISTSTGISISVRSKSLDTQVHSHSALFP